MKPKFTAILRVLGFLSVSVVVIGCGPEGNGGGVGSSTPKTLAPIATVPNQLDILGLVPGISELAQVKQASLDSNSSSNDNVTLEIGGHKIVCVTKYLNGKLAMLGCATGKGRQKSTIYHSVKHRSAFHSNKWIH